MTGNAVAIIPARGGSKRIPAKNIRTFAGKPMIAHSINAARDSALFKRVIVSTDSDEIAAIAEAEGAEVPFRRPAVLSGDFATTDEVLIDALKRLVELGDLPDYFCCLYATAPFVRGDDLKLGLKALIDSGATTAISMTTYPYSVFRAVTRSDSGRVAMIWPEHRLARGQDLPETYHDAGQFYWAVTRRYLTDPHLFGDDTIPHVLPRYRVQDIDTQEDWVRAEWMFRALKEAGQ